MLPPVDPPQWPVCCPYVVGGPEVSLPECVQPSCRCVHVVRPSWFPECPPPQAIAAGTPRTPSAKTATVLTRAICAFTVVPLIMS